MKKKLFIFLLLIVAILVWARNVALVKILLEELTGETTTTSTTVSSTTTTMKKSFNITLVTECEKDEDCQLLSVNCCPESAGAYWKCINVEKSIIDCPPYVICPQVLSPKPKGRCVCEEGRCVLR